MAQRDVLFSHLLQGSEENNEVVWYAGQELKLGLARCDE
jgi:hypothetical protein